MRWREFIAALSTSWQLYYMGRVAFAGVDIRKIAFFGFQLINTSVMPTAPEEETWAINRTAPFLSVCLFSCFALTGGATQGFKAIALPLFDLLGPRSLDPTQSRSCALLILTVYDTNLVALKIETGCANSQGRQIAEITAVHIRGARG